MHVTLTINGQEVSREVEPRQPRVITSQKMFFTPRRAVVPAVALMRSPARMSTLAQSRELVPWRCMSFQPE